MTEKRKANMIIENAAEIQVRMLIIARFPFLSYGLIKLEFLLTTNPFLLNLTGNQLL